MAWKCQIDKVKNNGYQAIESLIKSIQQQQSSVVLAAAKILATDQHNEAARAYVFLNEDITEIPPAPKDGAWVCEQYHGNNDTEIKNACEKIKDSLNELQSDNPTRAFYAKVVAADAEFENCYFALFIPPG